MTQEVKKALDHVREFIPDVCIVAFNTDGQRQYFDEHWSSTTFEGMNIDTAILEDAADSITQLPAIFQIN